MFYGIEQSTDRRNPQTVVKKFTSKGSLLRWMEQGGGGYTYADPEAARNWHHTYRYGYELHGRVDKKHPVFQDHARTYQDNLAAYVRAFGTEVERDDRR